MTTTEFSNEFDILYNNIMSNQAPGLSNYEKSVILTQAQESFILDIYNGNYNNSSFESTEEVTSYLNPIVKDLSINEPLEGETGISEYSKFYQLPEDLWYITYESVTFNDDSLGCKNGNTVMVKPITQDEYNITRKNPFRMANDRRVLRLTRGNKAEIISKYKLKSYNIRYIMKPAPIILEDLTQYGVSINNKTKVTECQLNAACHRIILSRAVQLAKSLWESTNN